MQCDLLNILTPFLKESDEKWGNATQKTIFDRRWGAGGQEIYILLKFVRFISSKDFLGVLAYEFRVKKSI